MALKPRLPTQISSSVEKADESTKTTLDHVRRILSDHDYLKRPGPDGVNNEKTSIVNDEAHDQKNAQSGFQNHSGPCSANSKIEKVGELPNEGIQANNLCSLLDMFEAAIGNSARILTPATSPGRSENWGEPLSLKINSHVNATDLTPPTTPPIQEQPEQKHVQNDCKLSVKQKKETSKLIVNKNAVNKGRKKAEDLKHTTVKMKTKTLPVISKKVQQKTTKLGITEHTKHCVKSAERESHCSKRKFEDTVPDTVPEKKTKTHSENKNKIDIKLSENCQTSKTVLPETNNEVNESSEKIVDGNSAEHSRNEVRESLYPENGSHVGHVIEGKSPKVNKEPNMIDTQNNEPQNNEPQNNEPEESLNEKCSNVGIVAEEKLPNVNNNKKDNKIEQPSNGVKISVNNHSNAHDVTNKNCSKLHSNKLNEHNDIHNNNNNEIALLKVDTCRTVKKKNLPNVEKIENKERLSNKDDDNKSKNREESSERRTDRYNEVYGDERRKRKHRSRSTSTDEDNSEEERSNPRKSERNYESHSHDSKRRKENYRKYSSRDYYDRKYSNAERQHYRKHDDNQHHRKPSMNIRDIEHERKINFRLGRSDIQDVAKGERRVIYVGGLPYGTTRDELWERFRKFGPIEKVTVHLRVGERDNYGFVTFLEPDDARECIERGNSDPREPQVDLCFGGRRQFCGGSYVDFDSTTSHIEELNETYGKVCDEIPEEDDFDSLLRMCQKGLDR